MAKRKIVRATIPAAKVSGKPFFELALLRRSIEQILSEYDDALKSQATIDIEDRHDGESFIHLTVWVQKDD